MGLVSRPPAFLGAGGAEEPVLLRFPDRAPAADASNKTAGLTPDAPVWIRGYRGKRTFDLLAAGSLAVATAPLSVAVAGVLCLTGRGHALESEAMLGADGKPFRRMRFRTRSVPSSSADEHDLLPLFGGPRRPRTPFGRFLHATGLERLPELWSVVRGDLSLVGPAPQSATDWGDPDAIGEPRWNLKPGLAWSAGDSADSTAMTYVARQSVLTDLRVVATAAWRLAVAAFRDAAAEPPAPPRRSGGGRGARAGSPHGEQGPPDEE